jgi:hypothetical protein
MFLTQTQIKLLWSLMAIGGRASTDAESLEIAALKIVTVPYVL